MHQKPSKAALWLKPAALTIAIAFGLTAAPYAVTGSLSLDGATALAKSDKAKGSKKSKKSKGPKKSVSRGNSGNNRGGGSGSLSFDSDGTQLSSTGRGKPKKWTTPRGKGQAGTGQAIVSLEGEEEEIEENGEEELNGYSIMPAPVRSWTKYEGLNQGEVASTLKGDNSINGLKGNFYGKLERAELGLNPNAKWSKQLNYLRDNAYAGEAFDAFTSLGGDPENPPTEEAYLAAEDYLAAEEYLAAQALLDDPNVNVLASEEEIAAANEIVNTYEGDAQQIVDNYTGENAEDVVAQYEAWGDYETAEETANSSFDKAFTSGERDMIDSIADYSGMTGAINEYYGIGEGGGVGEEDAAGGDGEVEILGAIAVE